MHSVMCVQCLHDRLLEGGNGSDGGGGQYNSLGRIGPRLLHADAMLKVLISIPRLHSVYADSCNSCMRHGFGHHGFYLIQSQIMAPL